MARSNQYFVYIIECSDKCYYVGVTNNLDRRIWSHNNDEDPKSYTYSRRPVILKYAECTNDVRQAILREKQLKGWSRKKKEALFREDWEVLIQLSKRKSEKS